jgi:hypothetical protein
METQPWEVWGLIEKERKLLAMTEKEIDADLTRRMVTDMFCEDAMAVVEHWEKVRCGMDRRGIGGPESRVA